jgi:hypothetical protein
MRQQYNRHKAKIDWAVLNEHPRIKKAYEAWGVVIRKHQSKYFGLYGFSKATVHSIRKKPASFFPVWELWAPEAKQLYDQLTAAVGFTHGIE